MSLESEIAYCLRYSTRERSRKLRTLQYELKKVKEAHRETMFAGENEEGNFV